MQNWDEITADPGKNHRMRPSELLFLNHLFEIASVFIGVQEQLGGSAFQRRKNANAIPSDEEFVSLDLGNLFCG